MGRDVVSRRSLAAEIGSATLLSKFLGNDRRIHVAPASAGGAPPSVPDGKQNPVETVEVL